MLHPQSFSFFSINSDITIIGRNKLVADLFLDSKKTTGLISRMHARIIRTCKDGKELYELCDTSLNGTYVNDHKVSGSTLLKDGDMIAFGHIKGAVLDPGAFAPQKNSEFLYKVFFISNFKLVFVLCLQICCIMVAKTG